MQSSRTCKHRLSAVWLAVQAPAGGASGGRSAVLPHSRRTGRGARAAAHRHLTMRRSLLQNAVAGLMQSSSQAQDSAHDTAFIMSGKD